MENILSPSESECQDKKNEVLKSLSGFPSYVAKTILLAAEKEIDRVSIVADELLLEGDHDHAKNPVYLLERD